MGNRASTASSGFTIVETVLFLAVTGALLAGLIFATSATIGVQRYRDATESFKALLQQQYADITSVQNPRDNAWTCNDQASVTEGDVLRGQSDCVMVGKYMTIVGGDVAVYRVLASEVAGAPEEADDIAALRSNYRLNLEKADVQNQQLEWDARIAWAKEGSEDDVRTPTTPRSIALLFLRSPGSGQTYTFTSNTVPTSSQIQGSTNAPAFLSGMIRAGQTVPGQKARTICLDSAGITSIPTIALYIAPFAAGSSAIEVRSNDVASGLGAADRC